MSRSNQTELINPAVRFFDFAGGTGTVQYYDRETKTNVDVELPFRFLILDRVAQVGGGIDRNGGYSGFWSNSVRNTATQPFTVRSKEGIEAQGLYKDIKGKPGLKWITGLYIAFYGDDAQLQIGYLKIKGAALTAWLDFTKSHKNIYDGAFAITGAKKAKKGTNTYYEPVFEHIKTVSDESETAAVELDKHLQEYLTAYFAQVGLAQVEQEYTGQAMAAANGGGAYWENPPDMPILPDYSQEPDDLDDAF
jgi:hypothetical protein